MDNPGLNNQKKKVTYIKTERTMDAVYRTYQKTFRLDWLIWHINHYRLINAKSIFIYINNYISTNSVYYKYSFLFTLS